ncbi:MAG: gamma-butyrobetaine hydroxylase-like domain-containing protein [Blastopirellula sp. JB062]
MSAVPRQLKLLDDGRLWIEWSDGAQMEYAVRLLRDASPDALTREKSRIAADKPATELTILAPEEMAPLKISAMRPIGRYAYQIAFSDGHDSGIYTYEYLYALGRPDAAAD